MIRVRAGHLDTAEAVAVVRPARADGEAITAEGRRLDLAAGPHVADPMHGLGQLPVGGALVTSGGALEATYVIHVVVQDFDEPVSAAGVRRALVNALRRAQDLGMTSVAFPLVGTGAGNLDAEDAASILADVLKDHLKEGTQPTSFVVLVANDYEEEIFARALSRTDVASANGR